MTAAYKRVCARSSSFNILLLWKRRQTSSRTHSLTLSAKRSQHQRISRDRAATCVRWREKRNITKQSRENPRRDEFRSGPFSKDLVLITASHKKFRVWWPRAYIWKSIIIFLAERRDKKNQLSTPLPNINLVGIGLEKNSDKARGIEIWQKMGIFK